MPDDLLSYYEKELAYLRQSGADFARVHPKIAGRLRMSGDVVEDPHVSRLLEGVAYLNARIQYRLEDDFGEISDALLDQLYPHYLRPIPAMSVIQFEPEADLDTVLPVPRHSILDSEAFDGRKCRFRSAYETDLVPLRPTRLTLKERPFVAPAAQHMQGAAAVVHLRLETFAESLSVADLPIRHLRFFLRGQRHHAYALHELLLYHCLDVVAARGPEDTHPLRLGPGRIRPVGFTDAEALLPYSAQSFAAYRLLTEFMVFPEKFLFLDLAELEGLFDESFGNSLDLYFYLRRGHPELERNLDADHLALGCTPIVNLFRHQAEPISLNGEQTTYSVIPDARLPDHYEVYSVEQVEGLSGSGERHGYRPFYGLGHDDINRHQQRFWHGQRHPHYVGNAGSDPISELRLTLVDLEFNPVTVEQEVLNVDTLCSNAHIPEKLPFGGGQPFFSCLDLGVGLKRIQSLTHLTPVIHPPLRDGARWRLISHLTLNYLSLEGPDATQVLREILALYDFQDSEASRALVAGILKVQTRPVTAPLRLDGKTTVCRGLEIEATFDDALMSGHSMMLFGEVLDRFFALYCSINAFTRLVVRVKGRPDILRKWPPRIGTQPLI